MHLLGFLGFGMRKSVSSEDPSVRRASPDGVFQPSPSCNIPHTTKIPSGRSLLNFDYARRGERSATPESSGAGRGFRLYLIGAAAIGWVSLLTYRLYALQIADFSTWRGWAAKQHVAEVEVASERGPILDRNGRLLAVSVPAGSVYVRPRQISDSARVSKELAKHLDMKPSQVTAKLSAKQPFVWIKRQLPRYKTDQISALNLQGVGVMLESRRFYPYNQAASALIGKVGVDGKGLSGVEGLHEKKLHVAHTTSKVGRDALGKIIQVGGDLSDSTFSVPRGDALQLTIDADLQIIMDEELEIGRKAANAKQAMAIMIDSDTGEVVALSQSPNYNFNVAHNDSKNALRNLLVEAVFEPGSTMKPLVAAAAIDAGVARPTDMVDCENGRFPYSTHTIKDVHPSGVISVSDVVVRSSNIGMTKLGIRLGSDRLYNYLRKFGFGQPSGLGLSGESAGILRPVKSWSKIDVATHSFGQGIAVTPLQVVRAVASIANGGVLPKLSVVMGDYGPPAGERILSKKSADIAKEMMYGVTEDEHGTGSKAKVEGVRVGGKTGTAQKAVANGRGYAAGLYVASFVGFVDATSVGIERNLTTMVVIDEPHAGTIYGGTLAAPVFQKIMERSLKFIGARRELGGSSSKSELSPRLVDPEAGIDDIKGALLPAGFSRSR